MAIVINGSGTVTGLAVGGLPDGTVDSGTIATGTIVNADINDLAASKLTGALPAISGASLTGLTSAQMPAGSFLKSTSYDYPPYASTTSTGFASIGTSVSYTVVNTGCALYINQTFNLAKHGNTNYWIYARLLIDGQSYQEMTAAMHTQDNAYIPTGFNGLFKSLSLTAGDTVVLQMQIKTSNAANAAALDDGSNLGSGLIVHEIKG